MSDAKASPSDVSGPNRLSADALATVPGVSSAKDKKMPGLVYFYVPISSAVAAGTEKPSPQLKACRSNAIDLFSGRSKPLGVLARSFVCTKVNVDGVTAKQDPVFNSQAAPLVLVTAADGSRVALLSGKIEEAQLVAAMQAALQKSGLNGAAMVAQGEQLLAQIRKLEDERIRLRMKAGAAASRSQTELDQVEKNLADAYKALENLGKPKETKAS